MIDNITIRTSYNDQDFERLTHRLGLFAPIDSDKIKVDWSNLRFKYYPNNQVLTLSNSLHKFYNLEFNELLMSPVNHNNFSYSDFYTVASYLSEWVFQKSLNELNISSRFEFGFNISTDSHKPFDLLSKFQSCVTTHVNEFFTVEPYKGKPIQRNCRFSDWYIKGYDKGKQVGLNNINLLRFEIVVTEMRKLRQVLGTQTTTLNDICNPLAWHTLFKFLISTYDNIRKVPQIDRIVLPVDEIHSIYGYCNKLLRADLKQHLSDHHFEILNKQNKTVYDRFNLSDNNYHNVIRQKMYNNYALLVPESSGELQHV